MIKVLYVFMLILIISFFIPNRVISQTSTGGTGVTSTGAQLPSGGSTTPEVLPSAPDFPDYMVFPREDLNPLGLSSMQKSTETDYVTDYGTFGTTTKPPSNIEVNAPIERRPQDGINDEPNEAIPDVSVIGEVGTRGPSTTSSSFPVSSSKLYKWTDENGVLHVTNDLGSIPAEYHDQVVKEALGVE